MAEILTTARSHGSGEPAALPDDPEAAADLLLGGALFLTRICSDDGTPVYINAAGSSEYAVCGSGHRWQQSFNGQVGWLQIQ